jgi:hypothetical protein
MYKSRGMPLALRCDCYRTFLWQGVSRKEYIMSKKVCYGFLIVGAVVLLRRDLTWDSRTIIMCDLASGSHSIIIMCDLTLDFRSILECQ